MRLAALKEAPYAFGSTYEIESNRGPESWRRFVGSRSRFVVEIDGVVAGTASGGEGDATGAAALTAMWVDPRFRRRGVGTLLLESVAGWARSEGYQQLYLWVTEVNEAAQRLYERHGLVRTGEQKDVRPGELEYEMRSTL